MSSSTNLEQKEGEQTRMCLVNNINLRDDTIFFRFYSDILKMLRPYLDIIIPNTEFQSVIHHWFEMVLGSEIEHNFDDDLKCGLGCPL